VKRTKAPRYQFDPREYVDSALCSWYTKLSNYDFTIPAVTLEVYTMQEACALSGKIRSQWADLEEEACEGFQNVLALQQYENLTSNEYIGAVANLIAWYKALESVRGEMIEYLSKEFPRNEYERKRGRPTDKLLQMLVKDLGEVSKEWFWITEDEGIATRRNNFVSLLAFYLAKQGVLKDLECKKDIRAARKGKPCGEFDCLKVMRDQCRGMVKKAEVKPICDDVFNLRGCEQCRITVGRAIQNRYLDKYGEDIAKSRKWGILRETIPLFLWTPCESATEKLKDLAERKDKHKKADDIEIYRQRYGEVKDRKSKTMILNDAQNLYPGLSRKEILRILTKK
jgi:hypothetical protein